MPKQTARPTLPKQPHEAAPILPHLGNLGSEICLKAAKRRHLLVPLLLGQQQREGNRRVHRPLMLPTVGHLRPRYGPP